MSCVKTLDIHARGLESLNISDPNLRELLEKKLRYFIGASEVNVRFVNRDGRGQVFRDVVLVLLVVVCFEALAKGSDRYRVPKISVMIEDVDQHRRTVRRLTLDPRGSPRN